MIEQFGTLVPAALSGERLGYTPGGISPVVTVATPELCKFPDICPLCDNPAPEFYGSDRRRHYLRCGRCALIFVPQKFHLSPEDEKAQYDLHENNPDDPGYRAFLGRLFYPLEPRLAPGSRGLDFGSGPGPTLSVMFEEAGHRMAIFDKFYAPDVKILSAAYDFVTATEVVEHLAAPGRELARLWSLVRPGGWLGVMTKLATGADDFAGWHYKNDPTHIAFFSRATFSWQAEQWRARLEFVDKDAILLQKQE